MPDDHATTRRPIPGFPHYEVDTDGQVWTEIAPRGGRPDLQGRVTGIWRRMNQCLNGAGYPHVNLTRNGRQHGRAVHRLVLEAFVGPRPPDLECCHGNGIPSDNRLSNLRWDTNQSNIDDRGKHGRFEHVRKLSDDAVLELRHRAALGEPHTCLAKAFGVCRPLVSCIVRRTRWTHVPPAPLPDRLPAHVIRARWPPEPQPRKKPAAKPTPSKPQPDLSSLHRRCFSQPPKNSPT